ncbi:MAG: CPXCG motif-containing cysteine-rich protein [Acidobacteriota bacterium]
MDESAAYDCGYCGEGNVIEVDWSAARRQEMVEDCTVCCRPNVVTITLESDETVSVAARAETW